MMEARKGGLGRGKKGQSGSLALSSICSAKVWGVRRKAVRLQPYCSLFSEPDRGTEASGKWGNVSEGGREA